MSPAQGFTAGSAGGRAGILQSWICGSEDYLALEYGFKSSAGVGRRIQASLSSSGVLGEFHHGAETLFPHL